MSKRRHLPFYPRAALYRARIVRDYLKRFGTWQQYSAMCEKVRDLEAVGDYDSLIRRPAVVKRWPWDEAA